MLTFFSLRGYPCASLENDLQRVATINRPDVLRLSVQNDGIVDRVPLLFFLFCLFFKSLLNIQV